MPTLRFAARLGSLLLAGMLASACSKPTPTDGNPTNRQRSPARTSHQGRFGNRHARPRGSHSTTTLRSPPRKCKPRIPRRQMPTRLPQLTTATRRCNLATPHPHCLRPPRQPQMPRPPQNRYSANELILCAHLRAGTQQPCGQHLSACTPTPTPAPSKPNPGTAASTAPAATAAPATAAHAAPAATETWELPGSLGPLTALNLKPGLVNQCAR